MSICERRGRQPSRAELRQDKLIEAARRLFIENGFHATGIAQIARESGIAVGQIYRDFSSKEDIVAALVRQDCRRFMEAEDLPAAIESGEAEQVITWLCNFARPDDDPEGSRLFVEIVAESSRNDRIAAIFALVTEEVRNNVLKALSALAPAERLTKQRATVADAILTISLGLLHHQMMQPAREMSSLAETLQAIIRQQVSRLTAMDCSGCRSMVI